MFLTFTSHQHTCIPKCAGVTSTRVFPGTQEPSAHACSPLIRKLALPKAHLLATAAVPGLRVSDTHKVALPVSSKNEFLALSGLEAIRRHAEQGMMGWDKCLLLSVGEEE